MQGDYFLFIYDIKGKVQHLYLETCVHFNPVFFKKCIIN